MKITKIIASKGKTKQWVQYEPDKYHVILEAELEYDEDLRVSSRKLFAQCKAIIHEEVKRDSQ